MLRMDGFAYHHASSPEAAVALWKQLDDPMYIAGGTDLLPNIKHRIVQPRNLIGIAAALPRGWKKVGDNWIVGAGTRLSALARWTDIPPLAQSAGLVAGPQIRNMGTIGGNILLDTRCLFYNQTEFWRTALGYCLKAEGSWCHVIGSAKTCVAAQSSDTVPVLLAMNASIRLLSPTGERILPLRDLYQFNGMDHLKIEKGELLTEVLLPTLPTNFRGSYQKLRMRDSIDFPQLGVAICGTFTGTGPDAVAHTLDIVVGAANPQPRPVNKLESSLGVPLTEEVIEKIAHRVNQRTRPQTSVSGDPKWRRLMAEVFVRRGLVALRDQADG